MGFILDPDESSKSVYSDATDPCYLSTEAELFKVLNKILGTNTIWGIVLTQIMNIKKLRFFFLVEDLIKMVRRRRT